MKTRIVIAGGEFAKVGAAMYFDKILPAATPWSDQNRPRNFVLFSSMPHEVPAGNLSPGGTTSLRSFQAHLLHSRKQRGGLYSQKFRRTVSPFDLPIGLIEDRSEILALL